MVDIQVRNLTKFFVIGENLLDNLSFEIQEGERVAILGRNGCGKTTLFNILTGQMDYDSGEVYVNPNKRLGLISQIPKFPAGYTVEDVLRTAYAGLMKLKARMERLEADMAGGATAEQLREYDSLSNRFQSGGGYEMDVDVDKVCNGLGIPAEQRAQEFDSLSGGEKTRANLARLLLEKTDILLLDEPTNHLDIASREWVEAAIEEFEGVLLFVSHDRYFIEKFAERIWLLEDGKIRDFPCGYQKYRSILEHEAAAKPAVSAAPKPKKERAKGGTKDADKLVRRLEREIEKQEQVVADFDRKIEAASADYQELTRLLGEKEEAEAALMDLMEQWEQVQT